MQDLVTSASQIIDCGFGDSSSLALDSIPLRCLVQGKVRSRGTTCMPTFQRPRCWRSSVALLNACRSQAGLFTLGSSSPTRPPRDTPIRDRRWGWTNTILQRLALWSLARGLRSAHSIGVCAGLSESAQASFACQKTRKLRTQPYPARAETDNSHPPVPLDL